MGIIWVGSPAGDKAKGIPGREVRNSMPYVAKCKLFGMAVAKGTCRG